MHTINIGMKRIRIVVSIFGGVVAFCTILGMLIILSQQQNENTPKIVYASQIAGAGFSIILSTLLVLLYRQQMSILQEQNRIRANSTEADVHCNHYDPSEQNYVYFNLSNRGAGKAKNIRLIVTVVPYPGFERTFHYQLVQSRGDDKNRPILDGSSRNLFDISLHENPTTSRHTENLIMSYFNRRFGHGIIRIKTHIEYDDFIGEDKCVSGFKSSMMIDLDKMSDEDLDEYLVESIDSGFDGTMSELVKHDVIFHPIKAQSELFLGDKN